MAGCSFTLIPSEVQSAFLHWISTGLRDCARLVYKKPIFQINVFSSIRGILNDYAVQLQNRARRQQYGALRCLFIISVGSENKQPQGTGGKDVSGTRR